MSSGTFSEDCCVICSQGFVEDGDKKVTVRAKGLATLIHYCSVRNNEELQKYLESFSGDVNVHVKCRKDFTVARGLADSSSGDNFEFNPPKKLRSTFPAFQWGSHCLFCSQEAVLNVCRPELNENIRFARTLELRAKILEICSQRLDLWGVEVNGRLQLCNDLPAADAVYHKSCYNRFVFGRKHPDAEISSAG